jgi:hypothetical protein
MPQFNDTILGQSTKNPNAMKVFNKPDTDSRYIRITGGESTITPNLMHDHSFIYYVAPIGNVQNVNFYYPIKAENRSLHNLTLDNSNNTASKTFTFSNEYIFLDDLGNNTYVVDAGKKQVWFGVIINGKFYLRVESDSTN